MQELRAALARVKDGDEESRLDVIANAISYTHLLARHIKQKRLLTVLTLFRLSCLAD